ncbi:MAG: GDSL-type esterase/lipase family protein [Anaerocolumna sp.]
MTKERMAEIMKNPEMNEIMGFMMHNNLQQQKNKTVNTYRKLNPYVKKGQILFVGSSLMEWFPIGEMQMDLKLEHYIYNRGNAGANTADLLSAMEECIFELEPLKTFINIGSNDIGAPDGYDKEKFLSNYNEIMTQIQKRLPKCLVYVMAFYPCNGKADFKLSKQQRDLMFATRTNANILEANDAVEKLAIEHGFQFINVNEGLSDEEGNLKEEFSIDGVHMWPNAYAVVLENLKSFL